MSLCIQHYRQVRGHLHFLVCYRTLEEINVAPNQMKPQNPYSILQNIQHLQEHIQQPCR
jgi:hypothetical protein